MTLEEAADLLGEYLRERGMADGYTYATLGRLERGLIAYTQPILEAMAHVYKTDAASLLSRSPEQSESIWSVWELMEDSERSKLVQIAKTLSQKN